MQEMKENKKIVPENLPVFPDTSSVLCREVLSVVARPALRELFAK
jgi:hypothetical protein